MRGSYNFTTTGFRHAEQHGITPGEVFEVIDSECRLFRRVGERAMLVLGVASTGRYLMILVTESGLEPDLWDIIAVRGMTDRESLSYRRVLGGKDA